MDQSSHTLPGSDALPEPELARGASRGFQKAHSFSQVPMSPLTGSQTASAEQDLKGHLTKEVIRGQGMAAQHAAFCAPSPILHLHHRYNKSDVVQDTGGVYAALASSGFPSLSPSPADTPRLAILTVASKPQNPQPRPPPPGVAPAEALLRESCTCTDWTPSPRQKACYSQSNLAPQKTLLLPRVPLP